MHICFLTNEYPKEGFPHGGIGSFVKTLAVALVKRGIHVSVIGINYTLNDETEIVDGVHVYRLKRSTLKMISWYFNFKAINKKIKEIHQDNPINIVESSELGLAFISKIKTIKYIIRLHGGHHFFAESENRKINKWKGFQENRSFKNSDAFIAVSQYVKTHTEKYLSYNGKAVAYIKNPINTTLFQPMVKEAPESKIVFVGTVCEKKGIRQLIQAFPLVKKEYPEATLEIYGRDWFFPDGSSYLQLLKEKELPQLGELVKDIHFHGAIPYTNIPVVYSEATVCVFPSHMETQGLVAPEAMAMGKAVVFTKLGPGPETIENYKTGLLCDPHNPADIAQKIIWTFDNKEKSIVMGKKAREVVLEKYGLENIVLQNIDFYKMGILGNE
ncbi:glycosyltransferase family 4 protein [Flavobacterium sp. Fl-318]|uniref:Glycosyltransferase family 4 protein n=1 Tax=Flavobacterium cupriresistens TaxID=2893885 RepID=A0ABU4RBX5_9FLAO|nr:MULTISPECIES: glycosyltransferase family 4 protein [unclassified Flavobacterium]MDX6190079.1 glycosyltransferase family 4 protein [Flavobacterium sp. Fl-318]UFH42902.1 glycosyltransferase family 4 protein [Flavobacterium sp. F-323]